MSNIENLKSYDPFAEADEDKGNVPQKKQEYIHIRIQQRNGRKTLTTVQGLPTKFDNKKILKVLKKKFACNGTIVTDPDMGEVIQLQGDQRKHVQSFLVDKEDGLELDIHNIKLLSPWLILDFTVAAQVTANASIVSRTQGLVVS